MKAERHLCEKQLGQQWLKETFLYTHATRVNFFFIYAKLARCENQQVDIPVVPLRNSFANRRYVNRVSTSSSALISFLIGINRLAKNIAHNSLKYWNQAYKSLVLFYSSLVIELIVHIFINLKSLTPFFFHIKG